MSEEQEESQDKSPKKRITQSIRDRIFMLRNNGLDESAIAHTIGFSESAVLAAIKIGR